MDRPPRDPKSRIFDRRTITSGLLQGACLLVIALGAFLISFYRGQGEADARAISFTTLILGNIAMIWSNRSRTRTIPEVLRARNTALWGITAVALALLAAALYVPWFQRLFEFSALHVADIIVCTLLAMLSVTWFEMSKLWARWCS
jgi:Ca2+-transporting ATPase